MGPHPRRTKSPHQRIAQRQSDLHVLLPIMVPRMPQLRLPYPKTSQREIQRQQRCRIHRRSHRLRRLLHQHPRQMEIRSHPPWTTKSTLRPQWIKRNKITNHGWLPNKRNTMGSHHRQRRQSQIQRLPHQARPSHQINRSTQKRTITLSIKAPQGKAQAS